MISVLARTDSPCGQIKRVIMSFVFYMSLSVPAFSQALTNQGASSLLPDGSYKTKFSVIGQPMSALLDKGYRIINFSVGLGGVGYLLSNDKNWIACDVSADESGNSTSGYAISHCVLLN